MEKTNELITVPSENGYAAVPSAGKRAMAKTCSFDLTPDWLKSIVFDKTGQSMWLAFQLNKRKPRQRESYLRHRKLPEYNARKLVENQF